MRLVAAADSSTLAGVDVSNWQGVINWPRVAADGIRFAFLKASEGTKFTDPTYQTNHQEAVTAGLRVGAYAFGRPAGSTKQAVTKSARAQAEYFISVAQPQPTDLRPVLDIEVTGGLSPAHLVLWTNTFLARVQALIHVRPLVYTSPAFWQSMLADTQTSAAIADLWVAHWTTASSPWVPAANWAGLGWTFWQYTSNGSLNGISGRVDRDRYNGTNLTPFLVGFKPANSTAPSITGSTEDGSALTASKGTWSGTKTISYRYRWQRCDATGLNCQAITGATQQTYQTGRADWQQTIRLRVIASNRLGSTSATSAPSTQIRDTTPPSPPTLSHPRHRFALSSRLAVSWTARDGGSGVASYDLTDRFVSPHDIASAWQPWLSTTSATHATYKATVAGTYCFHAAATDSAANTSGLGQARCTTVPIDDQAFSRSGAWHRVHGSRDFNGSALHTTQVGASLARSKLTGQRFALYAITCIGCGQVTLTMNGATLATFNLNAPRAHHTFSTRALPSAVTGKLRATVLSAGRGVTIDAIAVRSLH